MDILKQIKKDTLTVSFEVFPPKRDDDFENVVEVTNEIARLNPSYISVTYGAGGSNQKYSLDLASEIIKDKSVDVLEHITCVNASKENIDSLIEKLNERKIRNVLALRGDMPKDCETCTSDFEYAADLIKYLKENADFTIGAACYPDCHPDSKDYMSDIKYLKDKVDAGCDFLVTQMFFENSVYYNYVLKLRESGIAVPVIPGIMPVTKAKQIKRICELSGTVLPLPFRRLVDRFSHNQEMMEQAGIIYATQQIIDLYANGVNHVHIYSMNNINVAKAIMNNLSKILGN